MKTTASFFVSYWGLMEQPSRFILYQKSWISERPGSRLQHCRLLVLGKTKYLFAISNLSFGRTGVFGLVSILSIVSRPLSTAWVILAFKSWHKPNNVSMDNHNYSSYISASNTEDGDCGVSGCQRDLLIGVRTPSWHLKHIGSALKLFMFIFTTSFGGCLDSSWHICLFLLRLWFVLCWLCLYCSFVLICFVCIARVVVVVTIVVSGISCGCLATPCDQHMFCDYPGRCRILQDILGYNCTPWISIALPEKRLANNCYIHHYTSTKNYRK